MTGRVLILGTLALNALLALALYRLSGSLAWSDASAPELSAGADAFGANESPLQPEIDARAGNLAGEAACSLSGRFPAQILRWCEPVTRYAHQHGLSPDLVAALIWLESGGDALAVSGSGAVGLMQVMPSDGPAANFMCANGPCFKERPSSAELQDPEFNIQYGTRLLAGLVGRTGDLREALKSYGPHDVGYTYADKVLNLYQQYGQ